jgi:hypothetical protein
VIERALSTNGQPFVIQRGGERIGEATGLKDGRSRSILFLPGVDIVVGEWLERSQWWESFIHRGPTAGCSVDDLSGIMET